MVRAVSIIFVLIAITASFTGCGLMSPWTPPQLPEQSGGEVYYNDYLGLVVTVPDGWNKEEMNGNNLTENPGGAKDLFSLDLYDYGDGGYAIELITIQNSKDSATENHAELMLFADYYPGVTENEYLDWMVDYIEDNSDSEYYYEIIDISTQAVNGREYTRFLAKVSFFDDSPPYYEEYYVSPVNDTFFVAYINYWGDSRQSKADAYDALENAFSLENTYTTNRDNIVQYI